MSHRFTRIGSSLFDLFRAWAVRPWLALLVAPVFAAAGGAQSLTVYTTPHYTVHTDLSRDQATLFAAHMHRVFENYQKRFSEFRSAHDEPMPLYLFRTQEGYLQFMAGRGINAAGSGGMFFVDPRGQGLTTFTGGRSRSQVFAVLQHEGFHQFAFHHIGPDLPIWINEGLAQYFEDGVLVQGAMKLGLADADRIERVRAAIRDGSAVAIERLVTITPDQWSRTLATDPPASALLYAQSWSMLYFMLHADGGRHQAKVSRYLKQVADGRSNERALEEAFGESDLSKMHERWRTFALQQQPDPVNAARTRLEFFAAALRFMAERDESFPNSFGDLRHNLQQRRFTLRLTSPGVETVFDSRDDDLFRFKRANDTFGRFILLEPARNDLPPRISAEGLRPEPTLVWSRADDGELVADIEFR